MKYLYFTFQIGKGGGETGDVACFVIILWLNNIIDAQRLRAYGMDIESQFTTFAMRKFHALWVNTRVGRLYNKSKRPLVRFV